MYIIEVKFYSNILVDFWQLESSMTNIPVALQSVSDKHSSFVMMEELKRCLKYSEIKFTSCICRVYRICEDI